jgi:hypothetical protein
MRMIHVHEPIKVRQSNHSSAPLAFTWRRQQHKVRSIEGFTDEAIQQPRGAIIRRIYRVRTHTGMRCSVSYDEGRQIWRLDSVRTQGGRS